MIKVSIEVGRGVARFRVAVQAESIRRALEMAEALHPGADPRVAFPIDPEAFFVGDPAAAAIMGPVGREEAAA